MQGPRARAKSLTTAMSHRSVRPATLVVAVLALGWLTTRTHQNGHDWGDDFALYIRQARSLVEGFPHQVAVDNQFSLDASGWNTFSPPIYPWGWPLLMAPVVAVVGVDYGALKLLVVALWCAALTWWFLIVRSRVATPGAWVLLAALGLSWPYLVWTNSVVSDIPYLAVAMGTLWWIDRCRERRAWDTGAWWPLVVLGLALAFAFNIRRDGLALVVAVGVLTLVQFVTAVRSDGRSGWSSHWRRWSLPFAVFVIASSVLQMVLPSAVAPRYPDTGLANVAERVAWYRDILAEQLGLLAPDSDVIELFGFHGLGMVVLGAVVALAALGLVARCLTHPMSDLPVAAFALTHTAMVLVLPFQEGRFIFPIVPFIMYFALQSLPAIAAAVYVTRRSVTTALTLMSTGLLVLLALSSADDTLWWADRATTVREEGEVMNGPARPEVVEMTEAVLAITAPDDVVAFFRARAMTMLTDRRSLQSGSIEPILVGADWYVMERGSTYSQPLLSLDDARMLGLEQVWENDGWIMFRVPDPSGEGR